MTLSKVAGYSLVRCLGGGAVGSVYKATSPDGALVAVKVLNAAAEGNEELRRRFRREYEIARKLVNPHIVRYLDFGEDNGRPFIVMEYVEGTTIWDQVRSKGPLPEAEVNRIAAQIGAALEVGHRLDVLHRDVKPNNVLLTPAGNAKLMDFGLVKDLGAESDLTEQRAILGTPFFMAPEQFFDARKADCRADVYGLAACLFFALTGKIPFKFRGTGLLEKKLAGQFMPPNETLANISPRILRAIAGGLHPDPDQRPRTAMDLVQAMRIASKQSGKPGPKPPRPTGAERRSILRRKCEFTGASLSEDSGPEFPAHITDISTEGACLVAGSLFAQKAVLVLSFCFSDADDRWDYQARVVNVQALDNRQWRHGCRFLEPMDRAELLALLNEGRENIRVRITASA